MHPIHKPSNFHYKHLYITISDYNTKIFFLIQAIHLQPILAPTKLQLFQPVRNVMIHQKHVAKYVRDSREYIVPCPSLLPRPPSFLAIVIHARHRLYQNCRHLWTTWSFTGRFRSQLSLYTWTTTCRVAKEICSRSLRRIHGTCATIRCSWGTLEQVGDTSSVTGRNRISQNDLQRVYVRNGAMDDGAGVHTPLGKSQQNLSFLRPSACIPTSPRSTLYFFLFATFQIHSLRFQMDSFPPGTIKEKLSCYASTGIMIYSLLAISLDWKLLLII